MIRTLTRLRHVTGDPLLVRAGRKMVFTPHAQRIRSKTHSVLSAMSPGDMLSFPGMGSYMGWWMTSWQSGAGAVPAHRRRRAGLQRRAGAGAGLLRASSFAAGDSKFSAAGQHRGDYGVAGVASAPGAGAGPPLAAAAGARGVSRVKKSPHKCGQKYWKQCEQCRTEYLSYLLNYSVMRKIIFLI